MFPFVFFSVNEDYVMSLRLGCTKSMEGMTILAAKILSYSTPVADWCNQYAFLSFDQKVVDKTENSR